MQTWTMNTHSQWGGQQSSRLLRGQLRIIWPCLPVWWREKAAIVTLGLRALLAAVIRGAVWAWQCRSDTIQKLLAGGCEMSEPDPRRPPTTLLCRCPHPDLRIKLPGCRWSLQISAQLWKASRKVMTTRMHDPYQPRGEAPLRPWICIHNCMDQPVSCNYLLTVWWF